MFYVSRILFGWGGRIRFCLAIVGAMGQGVPEALSQAHY